MARITDLRSVTDERLREHYLLERELSDRLRHSTAEQRRALYAQVYEELFHRLPDHPQLVRKTDEASRASYLADQVSVLAPFLTPETRYAEIGAGDCALAFEVARRVREVRALEVSQSIAHTGSGAPANFRLVLTDGCSVPLPAGAFDLIYSNQVMEHLHPDDARSQLRGIFEALGSGGRYVCITPNRLNGPHDVSRYFDTTATGFHLHEYTHLELARLFRAAGFSRVHALVGARGRLATVPVAPIAWIEATLGRLPAKLRRALASSRAVRWLLIIRLVGVR